MNRNSLSLLAAAALAATLAHADEGMWMPKQLPQIAKPLKAGGLAMDPAKLKELTQFPMGAVVSLGGCTASFVSPQGLVVTNHHCAYGSIQYNSKPDRDLLKNGFYATTLADELPAAPGSRIYVTVDMRDVSAEVLNGATRALSGKARTDAIEATEKKLVAACRCCTSALRSASPAKKGSSFSRALAAVPKQTLAVTSFRAQPQIISSALKSGL